jgi:hypothetical protein
MQPAGEEGGAGGILGMGVAAGSVNLSRSCSRHIRLARIAIHTSRSGSADPMYSTDSGPTPRTFAIAPRARARRRRRDRIGRMREPVPALRAALRSHDARVAKVAEDVLEELERNLPARGRSARP